MVGVEVSPHASDIINKECLLANTALNGFIPSFGTTGESHRDVATSSPKACTLHRHKDMQPALGAHQNPNSMAAELLPAGSVISTFPLRPHPRLFPPSPPGTAPSSPWPLISAIPRAQPRGSSQHRPSSQPIPDPPRHNAGYVGKRHLYSRLA